MNEKSSNGELEGQIDDQNNQEDMTPQLQVEIEDSNDTQLELPARKNAPVIQRKIQIKEEIKTQKPNKGRFAQLQIGTGSDSNE